MKFLKFAVLSALTAFALVTDAEPFRKKIIVSGWDFGLFSPADAWANREALAKLPVDGAVFELKDARNPAEYSAAVKALRQITKLSNMRESFLSFMLNQDRRGRLDWRDDSAWRDYADEVRTLARLAKSSGLKGLVIDTEDYCHRRQFFRIDGDPEYGELRQVVRRRSREFFGAMFDEYPEMTLFCYWLQTLSRAYLRFPDPLAAAEAAGDLWPAFMDGLFDVLPPTAKVVDGNESTYGCEPKSLRRTSYAESACDARALIALVSPENRPKFRAQNSYGCALYLDQYVNSPKSAYYSAPIDGSRLRRFDENLRAARRAADEYVWLWGEKFAYFNWKIHGPMKVERRLNPSRTWNEVLPGIYDSIWINFDEAGFLSRRFPELKRAGALANAYAGGTVELDANPDGTTIMSLDVKRSETYILELDLSGVNPLVQIAFFRGEERDWRVEPVNLTRPGHHLQVLNIPVHIDRLWIRLASKAKPKSARVDNFAIYRLNEVESRE